MTITKEALRSFDPIKLAHEGYTLRVEWSAHWVQVSITAIGGVTHYMRLDHEEYARWVGQCASTVTLHDERLIELENTIKQAQYWVGRVYEIHRSHECGQALDTLDKARGQLHLIADNGETDDNT